MNVAKVSREKEKSLSPLNVSCLMAHLCQNEKLILFLLIQSLNKRENVKK